MQHNNKTGVGLVLHGAYLLSLALEVGDDAGGVRVVDVIDFDVVQIARSIRPRDRLACRMDQEW